MIDSSASNLDTDPNDLRIAAGRTLNSALITAAGAVNGKQPDLVTVVDFDSSAAVYYPLGDPSGAGPSFDLIDSSGGTDIADGVKAAVDELTKQGSGSTADRSGIVVLTDGEDSSATALVKEIQRAGSAGIRVSFGFLSPSGTTPSYPDVLNAIIATGGIFRTIDSATAQQVFISNVLANGLTKGDSGADVSSTLISGLSIAANTNANGPNAFTYTASAGETINVTITALEKQQLEGVIRDGAGNELTKGTTNTAGVAALTLDVAQAGPLSVLVTALSGSGLFTIGLNSSLGVSNCTLVPPTNNTNGTSGGNNGTPGGNGNGNGNGTSTPSARPSNPPSPTSSKPPTYTGAAAALNVASGSVLALLTFVAAVML